jgi:D-serine deaminase-like pyridoxal phosphate-dependent protein
MLEDFKVKDESNLLTPGLLVYPERIQRNIEAMIQLAGGTERLIPHIKTHKMPAVVKLQMEAGINKFKCATLAEMKLLIDCGVNYILLAHQPTREKMRQFLVWQKLNPSLRFATLVDNFDSLHLFEELAEENKLKLNLWMDINNGMNRTGIVPKKAFSLYQSLAASPFIEFQGLHIYDGHIRPLDLEERIAKCHADFEPVLELIEQIEIQEGKECKTICGGSPSFLPHSKQEKTLLSPGTTLLWDLGYKRIWKESPFLNAAVLITRLISKPNTNLYCFDLGHKAVASEMPLPRVEILGFEKATHKGQSEEHLILEYTEANNYKIGDLFYALPYHVCPTVAKYNRAYAIENQIHTDFWEIEARDYQIELDK